MVVLLANACFEIFSWLNLCPAVVMYIEYPMSVTIVIPAFTDRSQ